ncbi:hypothetical protein BD410DRAFT_790241 [Rickenella mellea]|uniref:Uncharacterized protein n=1 Tax=Rickenella mellea TaxID=50990 RepID=A0A4Y7Q280_9AGAM|nr:hypothetical protein BD410DRAFT_790241 [Rickenella mellea]
MPSRPPETGRPYSSNYDYQPLTPRTPHSRAGREDTFDNGMEYHPGMDDVTFNQSYAEQQREPLLASSASASFPSTVRSKQEVDEAGGKDENRPGNSHSLLRIVSKAPLVLGGLLAVFLFLLVILSWKRPDVLQKAVGVANLTEQHEDKNLPTSSPDSSHHGAAHKLSYENYTTFPLTPMQYLIECATVHNSMKHMVGYWYIPPAGPLDVVHHDQTFTTHLPEKGFEKPCTSSITYMLDGYRGLAADLALMAQVAGLAREKGRTFFINDQYWNRGKWSDHFQDVRAGQPGPEPGCLPPPPEELVACPRTARHWVINSLTAKLHLGHMFETEYEDGYKQNLERSKPLFDRARMSLSETIRPNARNAALIRAAREEVASAGSSKPDETDPGSYLAVHIRRGDKKAETWPNRDKYVPLEDYVESTQETWSRLASSRANPVVWAASDSPSVLQEFSDSLPANTRVFSLAQSANADLRRIASKGPYVQSEFNQTSLDERIEATRGAIVDLAMLSGLWVWKDEAQPMGTVCTISSNMCKIAAEGLGWERAFGFGSGRSEGLHGDIDNTLKRWVDIDSRGRIEPEWRAFDLF